MRLHAAINTHRLLPQRTERTIMVSEQQDLLVQRFSEETADPRTFLDFASWLVAITGSDKKGSVWDWILKMDGKDGAFEEYGPNRPWHCFIYVEKSSGKAVATSTFCPGDDDVLKKRKLKGLGVWQATYVHPEYRNKGIESLV